MCVTPSPSPMQLHRAFQKAFGVVKEKRVGQDTATSAGRTLNPTEFVEEEFARTGADRLAQVWQRCDACGEVTASICALSRGVACVYSLTHSSTSVACCQQAN